MAKNNAYTVWIGKTPGVYDTWAECEAQVKGFPDAKYKGYSTRSSAEEAYKLPYTEAINTKAPMTPKEDKVIAEPAVEALGSALTYSPEGVDQFGIHKDDAPF
jgi:ribonuclease HI